MLKALSLKQMIFIGFGLVITLLVMLAGVALRGTNTIGHDFSDYRQAARESLLVNEANTTLLRARLAVMEFRVANAPETAQRVAGELAALVTLKTELSEFVQDPARIEIVNSLSEQARSFQDTFAAVVALQDEINSLSPQMHTAGRTARQAISTLMGDAFNANNADAAYLGGVIQQSLILARYYGRLYLQDSDPADRERALSELELAEATEETLTRFVRGTELAAELEGYAAEKANFAALFDQVSGLVLERNALLDGQLDVIGPQLGEGYASLLQAAVDTQNTIGPRAGAEVSSVVRTTSIIAGVAVVLGLVAAFFIARIISGSIASVVARMTKLADGDLDIAITGTERRDELGDMARALIVFQDNGRQKIRLEADQVEQARMAEAEKRRSMNEMADNFEASVDGVVTAVSSAAEQMVGLAQMLSQAAERAGERSVTVAAASEEASTNVETVAAASEEMTNSIAEVSQRIGQSASMTDEAARGAQHTTQTVAKLATSAQTIGEVISMISAIAEQTNLLALNATIEAARAGEAGKGFAVVASEVKSLANQTAKATEAISAQITTMQGDTDAVVEAIDKIGTMIQELNSTSSSIAAAVEEQHSATQEIARNTQQAADGTREVSSNITEVSSAVRETGQAASEVLSASAQLAQEAERLRDNVASFLREVRAA